MAQCPKCKAEVSAGFRFCKQCGAALTAAPASEPPAPRPPEPAPVAAAAAAVSTAARAPVAREEGSRDVEATRPVSPPPARAERERIPPPAAKVESAPRGKSRLAVVAVIVVLVIAGGGLYYYSGDALRAHLPFGGLGKPSVKAEQHFNQGLTFASMKDYDNAIVEFGKAIEVDSRYAAAYANRGVAYIQQHKLNKALDDLKQAEGLNPQDKMIQYNLTALFSLQGQRDRALDTLDKALQLGFNDYDALRRDPDLNNLRSDPEFRKVLEKHKVFLQ